MIRNRKSVSIAISLALAAVALGLYAYTLAHAAPTYTLANGVEVTPVEVQPDDVSEVLDIKIWKFDVVQTDASKPLYLGLSLCRNGSVIKTLVGGFDLEPAMNRGQPRPSKRSHVMIGLAPIGTTIAGAKQFKYTLSTDGASLSGTMPNILLDGHGYISDAQVSRDSNVIFLLSTNKTKSSITGDAAMNDTALALSISQTPATR